VPEKKQILYIIKLQITLCGDVWKADFIN